MNSKLARNYKKILSSVLKILLLVLFSFFLGSVIIFPLYKLATNFQTFYTFSVLAVTAIVLIVLVIKKVKSTGLKKTLIFVLKSLVICFGLAISIILVFSGKRFFAIPTILITIFIYGLLKGIS